jgi:hypothetical protein
MDCYHWTLRILSDQVLVKPGNALKSIWISIYPDGLTRGYCQETLLSSQLGL